MLQFLLDAHVVGLFGCVVSIYGKVLSLLFPGLISLLDSNKMTVIALTSLDFTTTSDFFLFDDNYDIDH